MHFHPAVLAVVQHLHRQVERREITEERRGAINLARGIGERLALFLGQNTGQFARVLFHHIGNGGQRRLARGDGGGTPGREGRLGCGHGLIQLRLGGTRRFRQNFLRGGIDHIHGQIAIGHPPAD